MARASCTHSDLFTASYFDRPVRWELCLDCNASRLVHEAPKQSGQHDADGHTADGCMDDVQVLPYCSKTPGPSASQPDAGNSNRMVGLLRTPSKGVVW